jgi:hypothetical protein
LCGSVLRFQLEWLTCTRLSCADREDAAYRAALLIQRVYRGYLCRRARVLYHLRRLKASFSLF